jgi:hypothetical protein
MIYEVGKGIFSLLSAGTTGLITQNIQPVVGLEASANPKYPLVTYKIVSTSSTPTKDQVSKFEEVRVQIDCYSTTPALVDALCYAVRNDLDKKTHSTDVNINEISFISYGPQFFFEDVRVFMTSLDFNFIIIE